jgi:hypothetical protein
MQRNWQHWANKTQDEGKKILMVQQLVGFLLAIKLKIHFSYYYLVF